MASNRTRREALLRDPRIRQFLVGNVQPTGKKLGSGAYGSVEELVIGGVLCAGKRIHEALLEQGNAHVQNLVRGRVSASLKPEAPPHRTVHWPMFLW